MFSKAKYETLYKYGKPVVAPSGVSGTYNSVAVDCPFVFYHAGKTRMLHIGFNGKGYQTALSSSDDPISGFTLDGVVLRAGEGGGWDSKNAAGVWILSETDVNAPRTLKKYRGKYWMLYHAYPGEGYEVGPARMGLAWCEDDDLLRWTRLPEPVFIPEDGADWEKGGLYKGCIVPFKDRFYMFYNAKNIPSPGKPWTEQTGVAVSDDLLSWKRYEKNPVLKVSPDFVDSRFVSDPCVCRDGDDWLMFYFGFDGKKAVDMLAYGNDPYAWTKAGLLIDTGAPGELDSVYAHKPSVYAFGGVLYHYYCACAPDGTGGEYRCITAAASRPFKMD